MKQINRQWWYSPSDLILFLESPFATWMDRYDRECSAHGIQADPPDEMAELLQSKGIEHEQEFLGKLKESGYQTIEIDSQLPMEQCLAETLHAMKAGTPIIYQGMIAHPPFFGYTDFMVKVSGSSKFGDYQYEVWDTKLSKKAKPYFIIQLCCYSEILTTVQQATPEKFSVVLGNNNQPFFKVSEFFPFYKQVKGQFLSQQSGFDSTKSYDPADFNSWGRWSNYAESELLRRDHLSKVARITRHQIRKLNDHGIGTMTELANSCEERIPKMSVDTLQKLKAQARIQRKSEIAISESNSEIEPPPATKLLPHDSDLPMGLETLPPRSNDDIFFDIEGYPLIEGGLEYLWGACYFDEDGSVKFRDFWAHDSTQEKEAFTSFISWVHGLYRDNPNLHIYHYGHYEIAVCRRLMGRYGVCEKEVDDLLRNGIFVDLYSVFRQAFLLGEPRYSIKNVEHLYRGKRSGEVSKGDESIVQYELWRVHPDGETWETSKILKDIRDYNEDDCQSLIGLVNWLSNQQRLHGIEYQPLESRRATLDETILDENTQLQNKILTLSEKKGALGLSREAEVYETLAWLVDFYRRENKPIWWRKFDRMASDLEELAEDHDCLTQCQRSSKPGFKKKPRSRNFIYEYSYDLLQQYRNKPPQSYYLHGFENKKVTYEDIDTKNGFIQLSAEEEPPQEITLIPDENIRTKILEDSLLETIKSFVVNPDGHPALQDFLFKKTPHLEVHQRGTPILAGSSSDKLRMIVEKVSQLKNSYLFIQGPPGTGKTYTAVRIIAALLQKKLKIGISSNSHKAITHLLHQVALHCKEILLEASFVCTDKTAIALKKVGIKISGNANLGGEVKPACVIGTTAWGFARPELAGQFDFLFIDEAGQVSLAHMIAMIASTKNLVLLGDQMQLRQPIQGSHPGRSGESLLDYLLDGKPTIGEEMGIFLDRSYRMHPLINDFISKGVYEGQLQAAPGNENQKIVSPLPNGVKPAGISFLPVNHLGNTQASIEEQEVIGALCNELIGRDFQRKDKSVKPIGYDDILVVAPYNHQVNELSKALGAKARVGTIDKFQGQEAPIVIISMCTSNANETPRGIGFIFEKNRINVAISRAQGLVIVVGNPNIMNANAKTLDEMRLVSFFCSVIEVARA